MQTESRKCLKIRGLITNQGFDHEWYVDVSKITSIRERYLKRPNSLLKNWHEKWGQLEIKPGSIRDLVIWHRTDGGPTITDATDKKRVQKIAIMMLRAHLIDELGKCRLVPFVRVGYPEQWQSCQVFFENGRLEKVVWACAVFGRCEIVDGSETKQLEGNVRIEIGAREAFF